MSDDMKRLLRGLKLAALIVLPLAVIYFGWSSFRASRERAARTSAETEHFRQASEFFNAHGKPLPRVDDEAGIAVLRQLSFSPDNRFLSAAAQRQITAELVVWPTNGGVSLLRKKFDHGALNVSWKDKNNLLLGGIFFRLHKDKGRWNVSETSRLVPPKSSGDVADHEIFPLQDLWLQLEDFPYSKGKDTFMNRRMNAYSISTGVQLPLPLGFQLQDSLHNIQPLARWGKAPLRLARWQDVGEPTSNKMNQRSEMEVWDARAKKRLWKKEFFEGSKKFLIGEKGKFLVVLKQPYFPGNGQRVNNLRPISYSETGQIEVYDAQWGKLLAQVRAKGLEYRSSVISPDGTLMATIQSNPKPGRSQDAIYIYQARTLRPLKKIALGQSTRGVTDLAFSPDNSRLAVAVAAPNAAPTVQIYNWRAADRSGKTPAKTARF